MQNIILIGPQGCGKGTQAQFILKTYGLTYIEAGALIRARAHLHDKKADILSHLSSQKGILLPDGIVMDMICDEIEENKSINGYLFDGFPRSVVQYTALSDFLAERKMKIDIGLYIHISDEESIKRLGARRICEKCKKSYSLIIEPERATCTCGGDLIKRQDDEPNAIAHRLAEFHKSTSPILELMRKKDILKEINGEQSIEDICTEIQMYLSA